MEPQPKSKSKGPIFWILAALVATILSFGFPSLAYDAGHAVGAWFGGVVNSLQGSHP